MWVNDATMANHLITTLRESLERCDLARSKLIVAVSGGPDSLALALGMVELAREFDLELHLAHLDHELRPDSGDDASFVQQTARALGLPVTVGRSDVRGLAKDESLGIEAAARQARYRFLADCCHNERADAVVVAHTDDDQTETRLMHWLRGSGLRGLAGMAEDVVIEVPPTGSIRLIRPLLGVRHQDTLACCRDHGVNPRLDPSNLDRAFTRNRIRHDILPALRAINPRVDDSLARLARTAADAEDFIQAEIDRRMAGFVTVSEEGWRIDRRAWRDLPAALKRALLQRAVSGIASSGKGVDSANLDDGLRAADTWASGRSLTWPGGIELRVEHGWLIVHHQPATTPSIEVREISVASDQIVDIGHSADLEGLGVSRPVLRIRHLAEPCTGQSTNRWHCDLDGAKLAEVRSLAVRSRQPGDWIAPEGMAGRKKVQDVLVDAHIPRDERDRIPIVATPSDVAWIVGLRRDRRFLAGPDCHQVICLRIEPLGAADGIKSGRPEERACAI